jgi:hypothetical protein
VCLVGATSPYGRRRRSNLRSRLLGENHAKATSCPVDCREQRERGSRAGELFCSSVPRPVAGNSCIGTWSNVDDHEYYEGDTYIRDRHVQQRPVR